MSNKQTMKLYTEEQVTELTTAAFTAGQNHNPAIFGVAFEKMTPIELPSDEEIEAHVKDDFINAIEIHKYSEEAQLLMKAMCKAGALWMRDKIQGGNK